MTMAWIWLAACAVSSPFEGPGVDGDAIVSDHEGPFVVAVTHAKSAKGQGSAFSAHVDAIVETLRAMDEGDGLVAFSLRGDLPGRDNWTLTVWTSEEAMDAFVLSDAHLDAMAEAGTVLEEAGFAHWEEPAAGALPPDWGAALEHLEP